MDYPTRRRVRSLKELVWLLRIPTENVDFVSSSNRLASQQGSFPKAGDSLCCKPVVCLINRTNPRRVLKERGAANAFG